MSELERIEARIKYLEKRIDYDLASYNGFYSSQEKYAMKEIKELKVVRRYLKSTGQ